MAKTKLEMDFLDVLNKNYRMSIDEPRPDLLATEVSEAMDAIVTADVFTSTNGSLIGVTGARVVTTTVNEFEI